MAGVAFVFVLRVTGADQCPPAGRVEVWMPAEDDQVPAGVRTLAWIPSEVAPFRACQTAMACPSLVRTTLGSTPWPSVTGVVQVTWSGLEEASTAKVFCGVWTDQTVTAGGHDRHIGAWDGLFSRLR